MLIVGLLCLAGCKNQPDIVQPSFGAGSLLPLAEPLAASAGMRLEGVYQVTEGNGQFGDTVVIRWINGGISIFAKKNAAYFLLEAGRLDSSILLEGKWRYAVNTETGLIRLQVSAREGMDFLLTGSAPQTAVTFRGSYGNGSGAPGAALTLRFLRPISARGRERPFWVLAHRGGGRNAEYLGVSENTTAIISGTERHGSDGIEVDIHVSSDGVPFLYHDADLNLRLVQRGVLWGPVENYTWPQLRTMVRLVNGERIPSLEEALDFIVRRTGLTLVWLDLKSDRNEIPVVVTLQRRFLDLARQMGRRLEILIGIGDDEHASRLGQYSGHTSVPSLCELELDDVRRLNAQVWAPRWTLGTLDADVRAMHAEGRRVFTWTLDDPAFIERFFAEGDFDGILTNYPSLVAYHHYMR